MKIAIIGAGFAGLALAYYLSPAHDVTIYDKKGIGGGASGVAAGLLHPYVGSKALLNWKGQEALTEARRLLKVSGSTFQESGILRVPKSEEQYQHFLQCASSYNDVELCDVEIPGVLPKKGLFIQSGIQVYCSDYLRGLWKACSCDLKIKQIDDLSELEKYERIAVCNGVSKFCEKKLNQIKGQLLRLKWPQTLPPLKIPIVGSKYVVMDRDGQSCWVGATYEKRFEDEGGDQKRAEEEILSDLAVFMPRLASSQVLECQAGIRVFTPDRRPHIEKIDDRVWIFTGLGSKGLLYHALMAKQLSFLIA